MAVTFANQLHQEMLDYPYILAPQCPSFWVDKFLLNGHIIMVNEITAMVYYL